MYMDNFVFYDPKMIKNIDPKYLYEVVNLDDTIHQIKWSEVKTIIFNS